MSTFFQQNGHFHELTLIKHCIFRSASWTARLYPDCVAIAYSIVNPKDNLNKKIGFKITEHRLVRWEALDFPGHGRSSANSGVVVISHAEFSNYVLGSSIGDNLMRSTTYDIAQATFRRPSTLHRAIFNILAVNATVEIDAC